MAISWLVVASLFFYGWWNPKYLGLLLVSVLWNYIAGVNLSNRANKTILFIGIAGNLALLGYFKYANFLVDNLNTLMEENIIFEQIGYKVQRIDRVFIAGLSKKDLPRKQYRFLSNEEINLLKRL